MTGDGGSIDGQEMRIDRKNGCYGQLYSVKNASAEAFLHQLTHFTVGVFGYRILYHPENTIISTGC